MGTHTKKIAFTITALLQFIFIVGAYSLNEGVTFYDSLNDLDSILANRGTVSGSAPSFLSGINGNGINFTGNTYLTYPQSSFDVPAGSFSIWVRKNSTDVTGGIWQVGSLGQNNSIGLFYDHNDIYFEIKNNAGNMAQVAALNVLSQQHFTHIAATWEQRGTACFIKLFVNGIFDPNGWSSLNGTSLHNSRPLNLGYDSFHGPCDAVLDEFRFFDWPLSDAEVYAEYVYSSNRYNKQVSAKPVSIGTVTVSGKTLYVNGSAFTIKGVGYQPVPIGMQPTQAVLEYIYSDPAIIARDVNYFKQMNINTIRIWARLPDSGVVLLNALHQAGIKVIMGFYVPSSKDDPAIDYADPCTIDYYVAAMTQYVDTFKNHPAILAWAIGNENNLYYRRNISDWYKLANKLARAAYEAEGPSYHPTMVVNGHMLFFGNIDCNSDDKSMDYVDMWGHNAYTQYEYHGYFYYYNNLSTKPIVITEYGADVYDYIHGSEAQYPQADWLVHEWQQIKNASCGGTAMAYTDEWWKTGMPAVQDINGIYADTLPDRFANEEYWGIMRIAKNGSDIDILQPRKAFYALKGQFFSVSQCPNVNLAGASILDFQDFAFLATDWGKSELGLITDINGDFFVDIYDLAIISEFWLQCGS